MKYLLTVITMLVLISPLLVNAQEAPNSPIIFIYDASGSMWGQLEGKTKMEIAQSVLSGSVQNLSNNQQVGLVAYGHRNKSDCRDVEFLVDPANTDKMQINQSLTAIKPLGKTPLAYSAEQVIGKLRSSGKKATVILITDGIESCGGNICDVVKAARDEGIDFRLHIIGFGLNSAETVQLQCAAKAGGGQYYNADNTQALTNVLDQATEVTVDDPTGNFSVLAVKNGIPIDAVVNAYHPDTDELVDGTRTYADSSLLYLPPGKYDLNVSPLATDVKPITVQNVESFEDRTAHKTIRFDGAKLEITTKNNGIGWDAIVKTLSKDGKTVAGTRTYGRTKTLEVNPGTYDVELTALVMSGLQTTHRFEDVVLTGGETKQLEHNFKTGIAMIGAHSQSKLVDATVGIVVEDTGQKVTGARTYTSDSSNPRKFVLNPGIYKVTMRSLGKYAGKEKVFTLVVKAGETVEKNVEF